VALCAASPLPDFRIGGIGGSSGCGSAPCSRGPARSTQPCLTALSAGASRPVVPEPDCPASAAPSTYIQSMDVALVAGNIPAISRAAARRRTRSLLPMLVTAAGTVSPQELLVAWGAGVAGLQAVHARRLGAVVKVSGRAGRPQGAGGIPRRPLHRSPETRGSR